MMRDTKASDRILTLNENMDLAEAKKNKFEIGHDSFTSAVQEAKDYIEKNGYTVDEDNWFSNITTGRGKPSAGKTFSTSITLVKGEKEQKKRAHIQVYNKETKINTYELNMYIS
jgi:hypothetical protein